MDDGVVDETWVSGEVTAPPTVDLPNNGLRQNEAAVADWTWERVAQGIESGSGTFSAIQLGLDGSTTSYRLTLTGSANPQVNKDAECATEVTSLQAHFELPATSSQFTLQSEIVEFNTRSSGESMSGMFSVAGTSGTADLLLNYQGESSTCTLDLSTFRLTC